ncbi:DUF2520 domain-containing protein [soil metagenome]
MKLSIIGVGRLGGALAIALARKGYEIENLVSRTPEKVQKVAEIMISATNILDANELSKINSDIIIITTQDFEIENTANNLVKTLENKPFVFHTSGSLSSNILRNLSEIGCKTGSIHPLVSISDAILGADRFGNAYFCIEGEREAVESAKKIVADLGGKSFSIESKFKTLYHASAVTACGHLVALIDVAIEMLAKCGLDKTKAKEILIPLIESTVENLKQQSMAEALTGTFARADSEIFQKHLEMLIENVSAEALEVYLQLGLRSTHLAVEQGAEKSKIENLRNKISLAKKNLK